MILAATNLAKFLLDVNVVAMVLQMGGGALISSAISRGVSRVNEMNINETTIDKPAIMKFKLKLKGVSNRSSINPEATAPAAASRLAAADCMPKNVARNLDGMTLPIIFCQAFAANPPPNPCQSKNINAITRARSLFILVDSHAIKANPKKGMRSWMVVNKTKGL
ncbi:MAG: hypothetical protein ROW52_08955 [Anaerolineaceae bacterium]